MFCLRTAVGKTTLAHIIAAELGVQIYVTSGPVIERPGDLAAILTNLEPHAVLFIDEVHRLNRTVEEILYPALEEYALDIIIGKGPSARSVRIDLPRFTLVGATTRAGALSAPLRDRFGIINRLEYYTDEELEEIICRAASILAIPIEKEGARELAARARGTPRIANRLLKRVRDFAQVKGEGVITAAIVGAWTSEVDPWAWTGGRLLRRPSPGSLTAVRWVWRPWPRQPRKQSRRLRMSTNLLLQIGFQRTPRGRIIPGWAGSILA